MIGRLRGTIAARGTEAVVIDVAGVGYEVATPSRDLAALPSVGDEAVLHTHLHVREDQLALFGFADEESRDMFRMLIATSGVGPKLALAVLGAMSPQQVRAAVLSEDLDALVAVPGIGKRSAQKLVLDLTAKLALPPGETTTGAGGLPEVRAALQRLGMSAREIGEATEGLEGDDVESMLRTALQRLGR